jgi:hypothetical protein
VYIWMTLGTRVTDFRRIIVRYIYTLQKVLTLLQYFNDLKHFQSEISNALWHVFIGSPIKNTQTKTLSKPTAEHS